jgi:acyl carrier protein
MGHRLAVVAESVQGLVERLDRLVAAAVAQPSAREGGREEPDPEARVLDSSVPVRSACWGQVAREHRDRPLATGQVRAWLDAGELERLAREWVAGRDVDWAAVYADQGLSRTPLPGYPFRGERYWIDQVGAEAPESSEMDETSARTASQPPVDQPLSDTARDAASDLGGNDEDCDQEGSPGDVASSNPVASRSGGSQDLERAAQRALIGLMTEVLAVPANEVDVDESFGDYGFDSISLTELAERIEESLGIEISPTIFFELSTVRGLAAHIVREGPVALAAEACFREPEAGSFGAGEPEPGQLETQRPEPRRESTGAQPPPEPAMVGRASGRAEVADVGADDHGDQTAVVGMSGIFPGAESLEAFWMALASQS